MTTHADLVAGIERATGLNASTLLAQLADQGLMVVVLDETETLRQEVERLTVHRDNLGAMIQRLSEFLDSRSLNSWKHGACWAAEDAIKTLTEERELLRFAALSIGEIVANAETARAETETLRAKVAWVEAIADEMERGEWGPIWKAQNVHGAIRATLEGPR